MSSEQESFLGKVLGFLGLLAGLGIGAEAGGLLGALAGALILASIGYYVGAVVESVLAKLFFVAIWALYFLAVNPIGNALLEGLTRERVVVADVPAHEQTSQREVGTSVPFATQPHSALPKYEPRPPTRTERHTIESPPIGSEGLGVRNECSLPVRFEYMRRSEKRTPTSLSTEGALARRGPHDRGIRPYLPDRYDHRRIAPGATTVFQELPEDFIWRASSVSQFSWFHFSANGEARLRMNESDGSDPWKALHLEGEARTLTLTCDDEWHVRFRNSCGEPVAVVVAKDRRDPRARARTGRDVPEEGLFEHVILESGEDRVLPQAIKFVDGDGWRLKVEWLAWTRTHLFRADDVQSVLERLVVKGKPWHEREVNRGLHTLPHSRFANELYNHLWRPSSAGGSALRSPSIVDLRCDEALL